MRDLHAASPHGDFKAFSVHVIYDHIPHTTVWLATTSTQVLRDVPESRVPTRLDQVQRNGEATVVYGSDNQTNDFTCYSSFYGCPDHEITWVFGEGDMLL